MDLIIKILFGLYFSAIIFGYAYFVFKIVDTLNEWEEKIKQRSNRVNKDHSNDNNKYPF